MRLRTYSADFKDALPIAIAIAGVFVIGGSSVLLYGHIVNFSRTPSSLEAYLVITNITLALVAAVLGVAHHRSVRRNRAMQVRLAFARSKAYDRELNETSLTASFASLNRRMTVLTESLFLAEEGDENSAFLYQRIHEDFNVFLLGLKEWFSRYTGYECSVAIKLLSYQDGKDISDVGPFVMTFFRDSDSARHRHRIDEELHRFPYTANAAFKHIVDHDANGYYFCNNLIREEKEGRYWSANASWYKFYRATAVSAIREPEISENRVLLGFLCVDNKGGNFDDKICRSVLQMASELVYHVIRAISHTKLGDLSDGSSKQPRALTPGWITAQSGAAQLEMPDPLAQQQLESKIISIATWLADHQAGAASRSSDLDATDRSFKQGSSSVSNQSKEVKRRPFPKSRWEGLGEALKQDLKHMTREEFLETVKEGAVVHNYPDDPRERRNVQ